MCTRLPYLCVSILSRASNPACQSLRSVALSSFSLAVTSAISSSRSSFVSFSMSSNAGSYPLQSRRICATRAPFVNRRTAQHSKSNRTAHVSFMVLQILLSSNIVYISVCCYLLNLSFLAVYILSAILLLFKITSPEQQKTYAVTYSHNLKQKGHPNSVRATTNSPTDDGNATETHKKR